MSQDDRPNAVPPEGEPDWQLLADQWRSTYRRGFAIAAGISAVIVLVMIPYELPAGDRWPVLLAVPAAAISGAVFWFVVGPATYVRLYAYEPELRFDWYLRYLLFFVLLLALIAYAFNNRDNNNGTDMIVVLAGGGVVGALLAAAVLKFVWPLMTLFRGTLGRGD